MIINMDVSCRISRAREWSSVTRMDVTHVAHEKRHSSQQVGFSFPCCEFAVDSRQTCTELKEIFAGQSLRLVTL